jgi:outer membrane protein assembly complex protein YaeT
VTVVGLLVFCAWMAPVGDAQTSARVLVADVVCDGNRTVSADRIMTYLKTKPGTEFSTEKLTDDMRRLNSSNLVRASATVKDLPDGRVNIILNITEYPNTIQEVIFKNANHISQKDLDELTNLHKGSPLNPTSAKTACTKIQEFLKSKGRYFANVELEEGSQPTDRRVVINITEGPVVRVLHIRFTGNNELATGARLATQIDSGKAFLGLPLGGKFNPSMVDSDALKLVEYYKSNGYMDVRVTRELIFSNDFRWVDVVFHIQEGQRFRISQVAVEGSQLLPREQVQSILRAKPGDYYNDGVVTADMRNITDLYGWRGYGIKAEKVVTYPEPGLVRVDYQVEEKLPAKVGNVYIVGNNVTRDNVIRRVVGLYPGQTLQYPELRIIENDLARLQIFNTDPDKGIRPTVQVLDSDNEYKDVLVTVQEMPTGSLMFGAGVNSNAGLVGSIVLNEKNFDLFRPPTSLADIFEGRAWRGAGQELRLEAVPGTQLQRYTATFREPFLFDRPYSLTTSGYFWERLYNEYTEIREGGRISLGHMFNRNWSVSTTLRIENVNVSNVGFGAPPDYTSVEGNNFLIAPSVAVTYDTRDSYLRPTAGGIITASYEQGLGEFTFPMGNIEGSRFFTLYQRPDGSGKQVLAFRSQVGWAGANTPVYERFFAGGFQSIRGFQFRGVGPFINGFNVGGDFLFLNSLEYQIPIRANDHLYLVAFVDSGTVESRIGINDYRVTAGFGIRIALPMLGPVPIALDFGFPITTGPDDRQQVFAFWIGMFR